MIFRVTTPRIMGTLGGVAILSLTLALLSWPRTWAQDDRRQPGGSDRQPQQTDRDKKVDLEQGRQDVRRAQEQLREAEEKLRRAEARLRELEGRAGAAPGQGELQAITLKHAMADTLKSILEKVYSEEAMRIAVDERTNTLIVRAARDAWPEVKALIAHLDVADALPLRRELKVISLKHTEAKAVKRILNEVFGEGTARVAADERTNSLIFWVSQEKETWPVMEALITRLEEAAAEAKAK